MENTEFHRHILDNSTLSIVLLLLMPIVKK